MKTFEQAKTTGSHVHEAACWAEFDALMESLGDYFGVLQEITGWYLQPRSHCKPQQPRIDRILTPRKPLLTAGWDLGPVGVECKRSGDKLGPAISQCMDYQRAAFPIGHGYTVALEWVFVWPSGVVKGDIGSIMAQQRIGTMEPLSRGCGVSIGCGDGYDRTISVDHGVRYRRPLCGYKVGSR